MDHLQIPVDTNAATRRQRKERLKNLQLITSESPSQPIEVLSREKKFLISHELYKSVESKDTDRFMEELEKIMSSEENMNVSVIFDQVTGAGNSLLHLAARCGAEEIAELIADHFPELLIKRNMKGDTPLHVAARAKSSQVIELILSRDKELTKLKNEYGNTALHEAVYANHYESVYQFFRADQSLGSVVYHLNKSGESLFYAAVFNSDKKIIDLVLETASGKPSSMSYETSPLHAVMRKMDKDLLVEILEKKPELMDLREADGGTPLHCAASNNYLDGVRVLLNRSTLFAQEQDAKGNFPIHLACQNGHVNVVKEFIKKGWPNIKDLLNKEGQNILHVAAKNGRANLVKYLLRDAGLEQLTINEKDLHGNTALHLAAKESYPKVLFHLTHDKRVALNLKNNDNFSAYDLLLNSVEWPAYFQEYLSYIILGHVGAKTSVRASHLRQQTRKVSPKMDWMKDRISTVMLIAILITTVTFAAGFTVPGGVYGPDENDPQKRGMTILANKTLFQIFFVCNTLAMYSSTAGCVILLWASISGDYYTASLSYSYGFIMVGVALVTMSLAFMAAIRLVVSNISWLANLITIIATIFFFLFLVIIILMVSPFPMGARKPGLRQLAIIVLRLLLWLHESHDLNRKDKVKPENLDEDKDKEKPEILDKDEDKEKPENLDKDKDE